MATELMAAGGCYNGMRYAANGIGQGDRDWLALYDTVAQIPHTIRLILAVCIDADDMNTADSATFKIQWENFSDFPGVWNDLALTGEIKWADDTDLIDGNAVILGEDCGANAEDCTGKAWGHRDGIEVSGKNGITRTIEQDAFEDFHWAIDVSGADHVSEDEYNFRLTQADNTVIGTMVARLTVVTGGKIVGTTKNKDRTVAVGGVSITAWESDEAGSDPKPKKRVFSAQIVSHSTTGVFTLTALFSGRKYFLHFYKDAANDLSDGSPEVTAIDDT